LRDLTYSLVCITCSGIQRMFLVMLEILLLLWHSALCECFDALIFILIPHMIFSSHYDSIPSKFDSFGFLSKLYYVHISILAPLLYHSLCSTEIWLWSGLESCLFIYFFSVSKPCGTNSLIELKAMHITKLERVTLWCIAKANGL
jgi:hypothetical protein